MTMRSCERLAGRWRRRGVPAACVLGAALLGACRWTEPAQAGRPAPATPEVTAEAAGVTPDLFAKSRGFRELLEAVRRRGDDLDRREHALAGREAALGALERTLDERRALEAAAAAPGASTGVALAKVYQSMRPDDAAPILDRLDDVTGRAILAGMKERQVAAILAAMSRERAVALTKALAGER
jgi:hypothetical protein